VTFYEKLEYRAKVNILIIMAYSSWKPQILNLKKLENYMKSIKKGF